MRSGIFRWITLGSRASFSGSRIQTLLSNRRTLPGSVSPDDKTAQRAIFYDSREGIRNNDRSFAASGSVFSRGEVLEITPIGWVLIPLGVIFYFFAPDRLYPWMVFFLPFSATAVVNIGSGDAASGVQAPIFLGALWMAREFPRFLSARDSSIRQN